MIDHLIRKIKTYLGGDTRRIYHTIAVLGRAEAFRQAETGYALTMPASAIFHDIGILEAERKYISTAGNYQKIEGMPIARAAWTRNKLDSELIDYSCKIAADYRSACDIDPPESRSTWNVDSLVKISGQFPDASKGKLQKLVEKVFKMPSEKGLTIARFCGA